MNPSTVYAICLGGLFMARFVVSFVVPRCLYAWRALLIYGHQTLRHHYVVDRHALLGPWTGWSILCHASYLAGNIACLLNGVLSIPQTAARAGNLALVNAAPLFFSPHLSLLADLLDLRLSTYRRLHRACGLMTAIHVAIHCILALVRTTSNFRSDVLGVYEVTAAGLLGLLLLISIPFLRRRSYEAFLRLHQALSAGAVFCTIKHLLSTEWSQWPVMYTVGGIMGALIIFQVGILWYRNKQMGNQYPRMRIEQSHGSIRVTIYTSRPLHIDAGQYINIWVPSISFFCSHPFTVMSWSPKPQAVVDLFIEKRQGFTRRLLRRAEQQSSPFLTTRLFFSGPHGRSARVWEFECVLLFASGYGIVGMLPYLRKLIYGRKERKSRTRRIHVVWHVNDFHLRDAIAPIMNDLLEEDRLEGSYILYISIYNEIDMKPEPTQRRRYRIHPNVPDVHDIVRREAANGAMQKQEPAEENGRDSAHKRHKIRALEAKSADKGTVEEARGGEGQGRVEEQGHASDGDGKDGLSLAARDDARTLVLVSAKGKWRDDVRRATRLYLAQGWDVVELDYQPE